LWEFHIGAEYQVAKIDEWNIRVHEEDPINSWSEIRVVDITFPFNVLKRLLKIKSLKMKYLDRGDIESLSEIGLKVEFNEDHFIITNNKGYSYLFIWITPIEFMIRIHPESDIPHSISTLFQGIIKNKSELQFQLKRLKI